MAPSPLRTYLVPKILLFHHSSPHLHWFTIAFFFLTDIKGLDRVGRSDGLKIQQVSVLPKLLFHQPHHLHWFTIRSAFESMGKKKVKKKKKKGVGKKGKKKGALGGAETDELIPAFVRDYVTIHFKLINWSFLDFSLEVCVNNTKLYSLKRKITQRHGRISNLRVYHGSM
jgi:hypothetical protein